METLEKRPAKRITIDTIAVLKTGKTTVKKHTNMQTKNTIKSILFTRGFERIVPTEEVLHNLDLTLHRFNKIVENKVEMTITEASGFANWLGVPIEELTLNIEKSSLNN